jgi:hypothetical protein
LGDGDGIPRAAGCHQCFSPSIVNICYTNLTHQ